MKIDLKEDAVYQVKNGKLKKITTPLTGYGKQVILWQDGKIAHSEISYTEK